ncbi:ACT domain-containing protein [Sphingomonas daechungensis]|uniref:ACT domain-containing protein n=1 Tax=Sphingomonas daechungensis TaxID=1176646 RepID=A0ABX6T665_9SPHN|nr:ACT domain-containing protein [Sphingomonas daechungensis]
MGGERDLSRLLRGLKPALHPGRYSFAPTDEPSLPSDAFALIREDEELTIIRPSPAGEWARISLPIYSSLDAVGLTAALSSALAEAEISANVVAALRHDHIFVPWDERHRALACFEELSL